MASRRSFRRAAVDTFVTQPALSAQIRLLERELGTKLIDRSSRPITLTPSGLVLYERAVKVLDEIDSIKSEISDSDEVLRGRVEVGAMHYLVHLELPDLLATFGSQHPNVEIHTHIGNSGEIRSMLIDGHLDLGLLHGLPSSVGPKFDGRVLHDVPLVFITAHDSRRRRRAAVPLEALADEAFILFHRGAGIREVLESAMEQVETTPRIAFECGDMATAIRLVSKGLGIAVVPRALADRESDKVAQIAVADCQLSRPLSLVWPAARYRSRAVDSLADLLLVSL